MAVYYATESEDITLEHHGIKGQKWGVRRFQNPDGTLTKEGQKRYGGKKKVQTGPGMILYRTQSTGDDEGQTRKRLYVSADRKEGSKFATKLIGPTTLLNNGQMFVAKYENTNTIKIPSLKEQEKLELAVLKDKFARQDVIDSLVKKGCKTKDAIKLTDPNLRTKETIKQFVSVLSVVPFGALTVASPALGAVALSTGAPVVLPALGVIEGAANKKEQIKALRNVQGDDKAVNYNEAFNRALRNKGYNAFRDMNDNGRVSKTALVVIDPDKNVRLSSSEKISKERFGELYKEAKSLEVSKKEADFIPDSEKAKGEEIYQRLLNAYADILIAKEKEEKRKEEREKVLAKVS